MISDVRSALKNIAGFIIPVNQATGLGRVFELYVMTGIAERLLILGWSVKLLGSDGVVLGAGDPFIQRVGKPGGVAPASSGNNGPSSILITKPKSAWEIWSGVQFRGRGNALHEFDIAIVPKKLADDLRNRPSVGFP